MALRRIAFSTAINGLNLFSSLLTNLWLMREVAKTIPKEQIGLLFTVMSFLGCLGLFQFGLDLISAQRIAMALGRGDTMGAARVFRQFRFFNTYLAIIIAACTILYGILNHYFDSGPTGTLVILCGLTLASTLGISPSIAALSGAQSLHTVALIRMIGTLFSTFTAYGLLLAGLGILALPISLLGAQIAVSITLQIARRRKCPWTRIPLADPWAGFWELLKHGFVACLNSAINLLEVLCEPIIFQLVSPEPLADYALYTLWLRFPHLAISVSAILVNNGSPTMAATWAADHEDGIRLFRKLFVLCLLVAFMAAIGVGVWLTPVLHFWLNGQYDVSGGPALSNAFAMMIGLRGIQNLMANWCLTLNLRRAILGGSILHTGGKFGLSLLLVPWLGPLGLVAAWCCGLTLCVFWYGFGLRALGVLPMRWLVLSFALILGICTATYFGGLATEGMSFHFTILGIALTGAALIAAFAILISQWRRMTRASRSSPVPTTIENSSFPDAISNRLSE